MGTSIRQRFRMFLYPWSNMIHGSLAHAFFALTVSLALFTSGEWNRTPTRLAPQDAAHLGRLCLLTTGLLSARWRFLPPTG